MRLLALADNCTFPWDPFLKKWGVLCWGAAKVLKGDMAKIARINIGNMSIETIRFRMQDFSFWWVILEKYFHSKDRRSAIDKIVLPQQELPHSYETLAIRKYIHPGFYFALMN